MSVRQARANLAEVIDKAVAGEATVITRNGRPAAAVVPIDEYEALEEAADELPARQAAEHIDEPTVPMAEMLADLFAGDSSAARHTPCASPGPPGASRVPSTAPRR